MHPMKQTSSDEGSPLEITVSMSILNGSRVPGGWAVRGSGWCGRRKLFWRACAACRFDVACRVKLKYGVYGRWQAAGPGTILGHFESLFKSLGNRIPCSPKLPCTNHGTVCDFFARTDPKPCVKPCICFLSQDHLVSHCDGGSFRSGQIRKRFR